MSDRISGVKLKGQIVVIKSGVGKEKTSHLVTLLCSDGNGGADTVKVFASKLDANDKAGANVEYPVSISVGNRGDLFVMRNDR